jgi:hypothetical protein
MSTILASEPYLKTVPAWVINVTQKTDDEFCNQLMVSSAGAAANAPLVRVRVVTTVQFARRVVMGVKMKEITNGAERLRQVVCPSPDGSLRTPKQICNAETNQRPIHLRRYSLWENAILLRRNMNSATIDPATFTVAGPGGVAVAGTVGYTASGSVATFTPTANLAYSTLYTATITTGATNSAGTPLAGSYTWSFTTITPPPTVSSTVPGNGATGVLPTQVLSSVFNEAMNCATLLLPATTFNVTGPAGASVAGAESHRQRRYLLRQRLRWQTTLRIRRM